MSDDTITVTRPAVAMITVVPRASASIGEKGEKGDKGDPGDEGASAYEVAVTEGFVGTEDEWLASLIGPPGAASTVPGPPGASVKGDKGDQGDIGPAGQQGETGAPGASTGAFPMQWKANTDATDPNNGYIKANTTPATAYTEFYCSVYDKNGQGLVALNELEVGDSIFLYEANQISTWNRYELSAPLTMNGTPIAWATLPVTYVETGPTPFTPAGNQNLLLTLPIRGEPGPAGADGGQGPQGIPGTAASVDVAATITLAPGIPATVENLGSTAAAMLRFSIPKGDKGDQGDPGDVGPASTEPGPPGQQGIPGPPGGNAQRTAWTWRSSASTTVASGEATVNNAEPAAATMLTLHRIDRQGIDWSPFLVALTDQYTIYLQYASNADSWHRYDINGTPTTDGTKISVPVVTQAGSAAGTEPLDGVAVLVVFEPPPPVVAAYRGPAPPTEDLIAGQTLWLETTAGPEFLPVAPIRLWTGTIWEDIPGGEGGVPAGGTTGQVLAKDSGTDYDVEWIDPPAGGGGGITAEDAVDAVAAALVAGTGIDITYNDTGNTITVDTEAGTKLTDLTAQTAGGLATSDIIETVDLSDTTMAATGTNKKLSFSNLISFLLANGFQPSDAELTALAGLTSAADQVPYFNGVGSAALTTLTSTARGLIGGANASAMRGTLGIVSGTETAAGLVELATAAETTTGTSTVLATHPAGVKAVADTKQPLDTELTALAGLTSAADQVPYFTGAGTAALMTVTSAARGVLDETSTASMMSAMGGLTTAAASTTYHPIRRTLNPITATTFQPNSNHENFLVTLSNAAAITVTLPSNATAAITDGVEIEFMWLGVGQPTFVAGGGATVTSKTGSLKMRSRYSIVKAKKIATNDWELYGDLEEPAFTATVPGFVPAPTTATGKFLKDDATWATPAGGGGLTDGDKGDITVGGTGTTLTIDDDAVTFAKLQNLAANRIIGTDNTAGNAMEIPCTAASRSLMANPTTAAWKIELGLDNVANTTDAAKPISTATQTALDAKQPLDTELTALAGLTSAADKLPYFTGAGTAALADFTSIGRDLLDSNTVGQAQATLSLVVDTNVAPARRVVSAETTTSVPINSTSYENKFITLSNASAITVTLPQNSDTAFTVGAEIDFLWLGAGQPTFAAGTGATVNGTPGLKLRAQYSAATAKKISTNGWVVIGDLSA